MTLKVEPGFLTEPIVLPASKSHANRFLILAARRGAETTIHQLPASDDVQLLLKSLREMGLAVSGEKDVVFHNSFPACESQNSAPLVLTVGEGGTTARFLAALVSKGHRTYILRTTGRLALRPWAELLDVLKTAGAKISWQGNDLSIQGPVNVAFLPKEISAARSTQFASALRLAFAVDGYHVTPTMLSSSKPYWDMTEESVEAIKSGNVTVPLDWSSAAYPIVLAAVMNQKIEIPNLKLDGQADRVIYDLLASRGVAKFLATGIHIRGIEDRRPIQMSVLSCPDLVPALGFLAAHLQGVSEFSGVDILRHKESDRLAAVISLLKQCGVAVEHDEKEDVLKITGGVQAGPWDLEVPADHRLVMTAALFLRAHNGGRLPHPEAVRKSFPNFFDLFKA